MQGSFELSIYTVKQFAMRYPAFSESTLRRLIANEEQNGFEICVVRPPNVKRVYVDEQKFLIWLNSNPRDSTSKPIMVTEHI